MEHSPGDLAVAHLPYHFVDVATPVAKVLFVEFARLIWAPAAAFIWRP